MENNETSVSPDEPASFKFFSFMQYSRHSKKSSIDSGIITDEYGNNIHKDDVVVISDDEDPAAQPEFELLCEVEFDTARLLPLPIETKFTCKTECDEPVVESSVGSPTLRTHSSLSQHQDELRGFDATDHSVDLDSDNDDKLVSICKVEQECDFGLASDASELTESLIVGFNYSNYILYICPQCGKSFEARNTWYEHLTREHRHSDQRTFNFIQQPNNEFECGKCQAVITRCTVKTLQQHYFTHLPFKIYKCKLCQYEDRSMYLIISHIMLHKDREELDETVVVAKPKEPNTPSEQTVPKSKKMSALDRECSLFIAYICPICGDTYDTEDTWQAHINFRHNFLEKTVENRFRDHFKCSECGVEIFSQHVSDLQQHLFTHLPYKSFLKCKLCNWSDARRNFIVLHILNLHGSHLSEDFSATVNRNSILTLSPSSESLSKSFNPSLLCFHENVNESINQKNIRSASIAKVKQQQLPLKQSQRLQEKQQGLQKQNDDTMDDSMDDSDAEYAPPIKLKGFQCSGCELTFPTADARNAHNVQRHSKYKCKTCHRSFALKNDIKRHRCVQPEYLQCNVCFREYNYEKCFLNHLKRCKATSSHVREFNSTV